MEHKLVNSLELLRFMHQLGEIGRDDAQQAKASHHVHVQKCSIASPKQQIRLIGEPNHVDNRLDNVREEVGELAAELKKS